MESTKIHTYFERPGSYPIIGNYITSWRKNGWDPVVLDKADALDNPYYTSLMEAVKDYPTVNDPTYELICYRRWLAFCRVAECNDTGIWFSDYDTLNLSLQPMALPSASTLYMEGLGFGFLHRQDAMTVIDMLANALITTLHMSDMTILRDSGIFTIGENFALNVPSDLKLLHFHGRSKLLFGP